MTDALSALSKNIARKKNGSHNYYINGGIHMLNFKNANGEIVMSEKDNGELAIHDEALKESMEKQIDLAEAKKNVAEKDLNDDEV